MHYIDVACRFMIALVFLISAASKLRTGTELAAFVESVRAFGLLRARWVRPAAVVVALGELVVPPLVLVPATAPVGFAVAIGLLVAFSVAIARVVRRGEVVGCRCFGSAGIPLGRCHLVRNGLLLVAALAGVAGFAGPVQPVGMALAALIGVASALVLIHFDDVVDLFAAPAEHRDRYI